MKCFDLIASFALVMMGLFVVWRGQPSGWWCVVFFGLCMLVALIGVLPKRLFSRLRTDHWLRRLNSGSVTEIPDPKLGELCINPDGFSHRRDGNQVGRIDWSRISRIWTYKEDLITTDCICVVFEMETGEGYLIHEEMVGFMDVVTTMSEVFTEISIGWLIDQTVPAFDPTPRVLFERKTQDCLRK